MQVLVIGANGQTGWQLTRHLRERTDHRPVAMIRSPDQYERFHTIDVPCILADLEHDFDHAMVGADAVIFAAGSGPKTGKDKTVLVDRLGAIRAAVTAQTHGVRRFVLLSSINARIDSDSRIAHYHRAKGHADRFLLEHHELRDGEPLQWTTLHPGRLNDDEATGLVTVSEGVGDQGGTSRANTALALAGCLDHPGTIGKQVTVLDGEQPIEEAFAAFDG